MERRGESHTGNPSRLIDPVVITEDALGVKRIVPIRRERGRRWLMTERELVMHLRAAGNDMHRELKKIKRDEKTLRDALKRLRDAAQAKGTLTSNEILKELDYAGVF